MSKRIVLFDPYAGKFTTDMREWWVSNGYEVRWEQYYNPTLVEWGDIIFFETCDNNLKSAMNPTESLQQEWLKDGITVSDMHQMDLTGKKVIVRPIDIEVWSGHHADEKLWDLVDDVIFPAPHIQQIMMSDSRPQSGHFRQHIIPFGVNLDRWTFKERKDGYNIAVVSELWESKGVDLVLQVALRLKAINPRYNIKWLGKNQMYHWGKAYFDDFVKHHNLKIELIEYVDSVDEFLEDKNYILHCSAKETYSYAVAEAMAKGIKPIFHRYYGADATWPGLTWSSVDEAIHLITEGVYDSNSYRQYLIDHHLDLKSMMRRIDDIIKT